MNENKLPILKITNIKWDKNTNNKNLPVQLALKWASLDYTSYQVKNFLRDEFNCNITDLDIIRSGSWEDSSG